MTFNQEDKIIGSLDPDVVIRTIVSNSDKKTILLESFRQLF